MAREREMLRKGRTCHGSHTTAVEFIPFVVGKYMQMMIVLKPIAFDVIIYMTQLFDYYLYSVNIYVVFFLC